MTDFLIRFVPKDDLHCVEKDVIVPAKSRIDALNFVLQTENIKEIILLKRLVEF